jgi:hypothetical protein
MNWSRKPLAALASCAVIAAALLIPTLAHTRGGGGGGHGHGSNYCTICARDSHGRIARSPEARLTGFRGFYFDSNSSFTVDPLQQNWQLSLADVLIGCLL